MNQKQPPASVSLHIISPPQAAQQVSLEPRQTLVFGRGTQADISLTADELLLPRHFSITHHQQFCQLTLLDGNGTLLLNNQPVTSVRLCNHDRIQAGQTVLQIIIEDQESLRKATLACLQRQVKPLYAIVDAAQDEQIIPLLQQYTNTRQQCLFEGKLAEQVATAAPYLVQFNSTNDDPLLEQLVMRGWGENWCIYINEPESFDTIRRHLRQCLRVKDDDGYMLFRFYDPRVFMEIIPDFNPDELNAFFGPIQFYLLEDAETKKIMRCQALNDQFDIQPESEDGYLQTRMNPRKV